VSTQAQADQEDAATAAASGSRNRSNEYGFQMQFEMQLIIGGLIGLATGVPGGFSIGSTIGSNVGRGVTGPSDDTQEASSVQSGPAQSPSGGDGGIRTIQAYAPTYNPDTGNPTMDAYIRQLRVNLGLPV
jgi:hypothetical protein